MTINIKEDILSITELKKNTHKILKQIHNTHRPVVLTVNGKAEAMLVDAMQYEKTVLTARLQPGMRLRAIRLKVSGMIRFIKN